MEEWRPIDGHPGYEVSDLGRVRSIDRVCIDSRGFKYQRKGRVLRPGFGGPRRNYPAVGLGGGAKNHITIHVLVCTAFHGPRPSSKHEVAHNDGNPQNSTPANLRWATKLENEEDKTLHGTVAKGSKHGRSKLTEPQVEKIIMLLSSGETVKAVARLFCVSIQTVYLIKWGKKWKHVNRR